ncbi:hypothetical protein [uncultured Modestobacter sp.]|uniref:hypothetical protein n=1 Tax=uncultured Modestobacter sp. TaxID=380048 RepID=UPI00262D0A89|nr:hypothetical protein [uncultured Modestobacter sp.]
MRIVGALEDDIPARVLSQTDRVLEAAGDRDRDRDRDRNRNRNRDRDRGPARADRGRAG